MFSTLLECTLLPEKRDVLLGQVPKCWNESTGDKHSKNSADDVDLELYSLNYFIKLACDGQTVALDMLHAPESMIEQSSDIWKAIVNERHRFYTKNLNSFVSYARKQASKYGIKGSRLKAVSDVLTLLKTHDPKQKLQTIWETMPRMEHCLDVDPDPSGMRRIQICGKMFQESASIGYLIPVLEKYYNEYGHRARLAAENRDIDWKAISHAMRSAFQVREILKENQITFPLKDAPLLLKVKQGLMDYTTEVAPMLESLMDEVETLIRTSSLPDQVETDYWEQFLCETLEKELFLKGK